jgi:hypothetical protein
LSNNAKIAQKKYLALKEQIKMEEDKKKAAIEMQKEREQEQEDKRNAVKLAPAQMLKIVRTVQGLTKYTATKDAAKDKAAKEAALRKAKEYLNDQRRARDALKKSLTALKEKSGDETKEYNDLKVAYYTQKAVYEQVFKLVSKSGAASQKAELETEKARFSRPLDEEDQEEIKEKIAKYQK